MGRRIIGWALCCACVLGCAAALAQEPLQPTSPDGMLQQLFGVDPRTWDSVIRGAPGLLATVTTIINFFVLIGVGIVMLLTFVSALYGAGVGNQSKRWSYNWVVFRWLLTLGFLVSFPNGYSLAQAGFLWTVSTGSSYADEAWEDIQEKMFQGRVSDWTRPQNAPSRVPYVNKIAYTMFRNSICRHLMRKYAGLNVGSLATERNMSTTTGNGLTAYTGQIYYPPEMLGFVDQDACGTITLTVDKPDGADGIIGGDPLSSTEDRYFTQSFDQLVTFAREVDALAGLEVKQRGYSVRGGKYGNYTSELTRQLKGLSQRYVDRMAVTTSNFINNVASTKLNNYAADTFRRAGEDLKLGWMSAGMVYMPTIRLLNYIRAIQTEYTKITFSERSEITNEILTAHMEGFEDRIERSIDLADRKDFSTCAGFASGADGVYTDSCYSNLVLEGFEWAVDEFREGKDLISAGQELGGHIMAITYAAAGTSVLAGAVPNAKVSGAIAGISGTLGNTTMLICGTILAVVIPMLPGLHWLFALIGFFVRVLESMIVIPIWVGLHALPDGDGMASQPARSGYMWLLTVPLQPIVMVAAFAVSLLLLNAAGTLVVPFFMGMITGTFNDSVIGPVTAVALTVIFVGMMVLVVRACLSLLHTITEVVMGFLGGGRDSVRDGNLSQLSGIVTQSIGVAVSNLQKKR